MWCDNLVETMPMSDMVSDLNSGATTDVSVEAWCDTPAYTQARTNKYGLTKGEKKYADGALPKGHTWALIAIPQPKAPPTPLPCPMQLKVLP